MTWLVGIVAFAAGWLARSAWGAARRRPPLSDRAEWASPADREHAVTNYRWVGDVLHAKSGDGTETRYPFHADSWRHR